MPDSTPKDPFAIWRDLVGQWEKSVNALANTAMASDEYSSSMHGTLGLTLKMQEAMRDVMAAYLANANLPSRSEVLALAERLTGIELRLERMNTLLERIAENAAAGASNATAGTSTATRPPRPPRTKRPPAAEGEPTA